MRRRTSLAMAPGDDTSAARRWYRRPVWLIAVAVVVIAVLAIALAITNGDSEDAATPPGSRPATSAPPASNGQDGYLPDTVDRYGQQIRVPRDPAGLALPQRPTTSDRGTAAAAVGTERQKVYDYGTAIFSTSDGPKSIGADGLAQGIAHTPQGSVIAATQITARAFFGPPQVRQAVVDQQVIGPDSAKRMLLELDLPDQQFAVARHVRIDSQYSDTFSRVSLATGPKQSSEYSSGQYYGVATFIMVWDGGQWKWRIPEEGFTNATGDTRVESVSGWTQW